jgi:hypothetical protein
MPSEIWVNKKMFSFIFLIYLFTAPLLTLESDSELLCFKAQGGTSFLGELTNWCASSCQHFVCV